MTKFEQLESRLNSIYREMKQVEKDGTGNIQYAEKSYFSQNCNVMKNHSNNKDQNMGSTWDDLCRLAKRLFKKKNVMQLTYEEADICVEFINECIEVVEKYEVIVDEYMKQKKENLT